MSLVLKRKKVPRTVNLNVKFEPYYHSTFMKRKYVGKTKFNHSFIL